MKKVLLNHIKELGILLFLLLVTTIISLDKVDYTLTAPGYNNEIGDFIDIDSDYEITGAFHTTSVIVLDRITMLQKWVGDLEDRVDVQKIPGYYNNIDIGDLTIMGYQSKDDSLANSLVVGISRAGYDITYETYETIYLTYNYLDENTLKLGDKILSVNGLPRLEGAAATACDETATFVVMRGDEELTFEVTKHDVGEDICVFGAYIKPFTEVINSEINYTLKETNTGGPSGGLMQALHIFNQLTPNDLTGGMKIAGTGTINTTGEVGKIGGIDQKIITSVMNNIDVFFVPHLSDQETDNYIQALKLLETLDSDMILVPVQNIDDAILYLEEMFGGAWNE